MVEMIVSPEISALDQSQTIPISTGVVAPVINKRSADTVVVTPDGQPVVIGGLMQNTKTTTDTKIPLLGDIPGLGNLFKHKQKAGTKTELMIFLTPHIIMQPTQLAKMSGHEEGATVLAPKAFPEEELNRFIDRLPVKASTPPDIAPEYRGKAPKKKKRAE
jgi:general secretion pathway protein D